MSKSGTCLRVRSWQCVQIFCYKRNRRTTTRKGAGMKEKYIRMYESVLLDRQLTWFEKTVYSDILSLSTNNDLGCFASDPWLAKRYDCTTRTVQRALRHLEDCGFINIESKNGQRYIVNNKKMIDRVTKFVLMKEASSEEEKK